MNSGVLITGGAGFIGSHLCEDFLKKGHKVYCLDNFDSFYSKQQKLSNLSQCLNHPDFTLIEGSILDPQILKQIPPVKEVVHLAAKVSVRPSIQNPHLYFDTNVNGTISILNFCRERKIKNFVFSSSSSVYGENSQVPWKETHPCDHPISPYAASKRSAEHVIYTYSHLYSIKAICLRFFTVFGPRQRPDLVIHKFCELILNQQAIPLFGDGQTQRDYTFIADIIEGIGKSLQWLKQQDTPCFEVFNLGSQTPITLKEMVDTLEKVLGQTPIINYLPMQAGDVSITYADISRAQNLLGYQPQTHFIDGVKAFFKWYNNH